MKKIQFSSFIVLIASYLFAGNLAAQTKLAFDGPYAGVSLGYNQTSVQEGDVSAQYTNGWGRYIGNDGQNSKSSGIIGGLNFGYDHRIDNFVIGALLSVDFPNGTANGYAARNDATTPLANVPISSSTQISSLIALKPKFGLVFDNKTAIYGMAGIAMGSVKRTISDESPASCGCIWWANNAPLSSTQNKFGYTLGIGAETLITDNLSLKLEMNYVDLGSISSTYSAFSPLLEATTSIQQSAKVTNLATTLGLSYKF